MNRVRGRVPGVIGGVLLLALALAGCTTGENNWTGGAPRGEERLQKSAETLPVGEFKGLSLKAGLGEVVVSTWDQSAVGVEVEKRASGADAATVDAYLERVQIEAKVTGDKVQVATRLPGPAPAGVRFLGVRYLLRVPLQTKGSLDIETDRAGVRLSGFSGEAKVTARAADVEVRDFLGDLRLLVENGQVMVQGLEGQLDVKSNGPVELIDARLQTRARIETQNSRLTIGLADLGLGQYEFLSTNSPVKLTLPYGAAARFRVATTNGRVIDELPLTWVDRNETDLDGVYHFEGWLNAGGAQVGVVTTNADVTLLYR